MNFSLPRLMSALLIVSSSLGMLSAEAKAFKAFGPGSSGGGGGVACIDDVFAPGTNYRDFFKETYNPTGEANFVYVLDYFQYRIPTIGGTAARKPFVGGSNEELTLKTLAALFWKWNNGDQKIREVIHEIGPIESWIDSPLEIHADSGRVYQLPKGCTYVQLAIRQDGMIFGDSKWIAKLSTEQRAFLRFHEALYLMHTRVMSMSSLNNNIEINSIPVRRVTGLALSIWEKGLFSVEAAPLVAELSGALLTSFGSFAPYSGSYNFNTPNSSLSYYYDRYAYVSAEAPCEKPSSSTRKECSLVMLALSPEMPNAFANWILTTQNEVGYFMKNRAVMTPGQQKVQMDLILQLEKNLTNYRSYLEKLPGYNVDYYAALLNTINAVKN